MGAIELFSPNKYYKNTQKQLKIAEKSDIRDKVVYKVGSVGFFYTKKDRDFVSL